MEHPGYATRDASSTTSGKAKVICASLYSSALLMRGFWMSIKFSQVSEMHQGMMLQLLVPQHT